MVVLIDTNVAINYLTGREDRYREESIRTMQLCAGKVVKGYLAFHSLSIIWYSLRKECSDRERRNLLRDLCDVLTVVGAEQSAILDAIDREAFRDFEDCLQDKCAAGVQADYIVTCNIRDFAESETPAILPDAFVRKAESKTG